MKRLSQSAAIDVHQHLWPPPLLEALRGRRRPPRLHGWTLELELEGEPAYPIDPRHHDVDVRREQVIEDELDLALISLSAPLGIELLPAAEGSELLDAYHEGVTTLGEPFGAWAAASLADPDPDALAVRLAEGFVGLQLPANALSHELGYARAAPLLEALETAGRPLLIHPGPASVPRDVPPWWPAIVNYVQQMHEAWYAFGAFGRRRHPRLRVCFAMLAGLAPLHGERFHTRAGRAHRGRRKRVPRDLVIRHARDRRHRPRARDRRPRRGLRPALRRTRLARSRRGRPGGDPRRQPSPSSRPQAGVQ